MLRIEEGGILGIGATPTFLPVDAITSISGGWLACADHQRRRFCYRVVTEPDR